MDGIQIVEQDLSVVRELPGPLVEALSRWWKGEAHTEQERLSVERHIEHLHDYKRWLKCLCRGEQFNTH